MPQISIVIPYYNSSQTIDETIESVREQRFQDWEIILVNDGSTDQSEEKLLNWAAKEIRIKYVFQENRGLAGARNTGILNARGKYLCFLDSDDTLCSDALQGRFEFMQRHSDLLTACYCKSWLIDESNKALINVASQGPALCNFLNFLQCPFPVHAVMLRRESLNSLGLFDESLRTAEDYDLWQRLMRCGMQFHFVNRGAVAYRQHHTSMLHLDQESHIEKCQHIVRSIYEEDHRVLKPDPLFKYGQSEANILYTMALRYYTATFRLLGADNCDEAQELIQRVHPGMFTYTELSVLATSSRIALQKGGCIRDDQWLEKWPILRPKVIKVLKSTALPEKCQLTLLNFIDEPNRESSSHDLLILDLLKSRCELFSYKYSTIAIFGCGQHTHWFLELLNTWSQDVSFKCPNIQFLIDENPRASSFSDIPVITPADLKGKEVDAIIVSTDTTRQHMRLRAQELFPGVIIEDFYGTTPFKPIDKRFASK